MEIKFKTFEEQIFLNTVFIENITNNSVGTGFLVKKEISKKEVSFFLFSNKHVFGVEKDCKNPMVKTKKDIQITLHKLKEDNSCELGDIHHLRFSLDKESNSGYFGHPDENVDVACVNISNCFSINKKFKTTTVSPEHWDFSWEDIHCGAQILFVGYPDGFFDNKNFLPVVRSGTIASIPKVNFDGERQLLVDAQIFPGSSGSPVFSVLKGKWKFLGIISDAIFKDSNLESVDNRIPQDFLGLGLLFKADTVKEVFNLAQ